MSLIALRELIVDTEKEKEKEMIIEDSSIQRIILALIDAGHWTFLKEHLHQCWMHIYGPVFWIASMLCYVLEAQARDKKNEAIDMLVLASLNEERAAENNRHIMHTPRNRVKSCTITPLPPPSYPTLDPTHSKKPPQSSVKINKSAKSSRPVSAHHDTPPEMPPLDTQHKLTRRQIIFQSLKQKQLTLNRAMKRSFTRKAIKPSAVSPATLTDASKFKLDGPTESTARPRCSSFSLSRSYHQDQISSPTANKSTCDPPIPPPSGLSRRFTRRFSSQEHAKKSFRYAESLPFIPLRRKTSPLLKQA